MAALIVNANELTSRITLRIRGMKVAALRFRAAAIIFRFGAWVAGVGIVIEDAENDVQA